MSARSDFWSRRKARVAAQEAAQAEAIEATRLAEEHAALEEKTDTEILNELGLPDPDTLVKGDDFSAFMAKAVPDRIRRRALRKLWVSNPALANLDGLLDYGEDFTDSAKVIENLQTAYQVGKGMLAHVEEMARQAEQDREEGDAIDAASVPAEAEASEATDLTEESYMVSAFEPVEDASEPYANESEAQDEFAYEPVPRRRMHFTFEDHAGGAT